MKKRIIWTIIFIILIASVFCTLRFFDLRRMEKQENLALAAMHNKFAAFVATWDIKNAVDLFVDETDMNKVATLMPIAQEKLGGCHLKTTTCASNSRTQPFVNEATAGSITCLFQLDCEKNKQAAGETYFQSRGVGLRIKTFKLDF